MAQTPEELCEVPVNAGCLVLDPFAKAGRMCLEARKLWGVDLRGMILMVCRSCQEKVGTLFARTARVKTSHASTVKTTSMSSHKPMQTAILFNIPMYHDY